MPDPTHRRHWIVASLFTTLGVAAAATVPDDAVTAEVWIDLSEPVPAGAPNAAQARQRRLRVSAQQERVAQRLRELGVTELGRTQHTRNAILVRIAPEQRQAVQGIPGVRRLRPSRTLHPPKPMP
jgi:predicted component of type VI protein secretion system